MYFFLFFFFSLKHQLLLGLSIITGDRTFDEVNLFFYSRNTRIFKSQHFDTNPLNLLHSDGFKNSFLIHVNHSMLCFYGV